MLYVDEDLSKMTARELIKEIEELAERKKQDELALVEYYKGKSEPQFTIDILNNPGLTLEEKINILEG